MEPFEKIEGAQALIRLPKGVYKIVDLYCRGKDVFIRHGGGYVKLLIMFGDGVGATTHPYIKVLEYEGKGLSHRTIIKRADGKNTFGNGPIRYDRVLAEQD